MGSAARGLGKSAGRKAILRHALRPPALSSLPRAGLVAIDNNSPSYLPKAKGARGLVGEIALTAILNH